MSEISENNNKIKKTRKMYMEKFYADHPNLLKEFIICEKCGGKYTYNNKSHHLKSKMHSERTQNIANFEKIKSLMLEIERLKNEK